MSDSKSIEQEPSIEEILASIRQIISDDDVAEEEPAQEEKAEEETAPEESIEEPVEEQASEPVASEAEEKEEEDILDLTDIVNEEPEMAEPRIEDDPIEETPDLNAESETASAEDIDDIFATGNDDIDFGEFDEINIDDTPIADITEPDEEKSITEKIDDKLAEHEDDFPSNALDIEDDSFDLPEEEPFEVITKNTAGAVESSIAKLASTIEMANNPGYTLEDIVREMLRPMLRDWLDDNLPALIEKLVQEEIEKIIKKKLK